MPSPSMIGATGPVDPALARSFYDGWLDAWNGPDPERVKRIITEDFVLESPTTRHTGWSVQGHDASRDYIAYVKRAYPDLLFEQTFEPMFSATEPRVAYYWRGWGTFTGTFDPPGITGDGRPFEFEGVEVFDFRDGRACQLRAAYDLLGLMRQLGIYKGWTRSEAAKDRAA